MKKFKLLLALPIAIFFLSILLLIFSPAKILPCETSSTTPVTSWTKDNCKGFYLVANKVDLPENSSVNNNALIINLVLLMCGSFLINGIIFLVLFVISAVRGDFVPVEHLETKQNPEINEKHPLKKTHRSNIFTRIRNSLSKPKVRIKIYKNNNKKPEKVESDLDATVE
jgi:hypothetical protein